MSGLQGHTPGPWSVGQRLTNGSLPIYRNGDPRMEVAKVNGHAGEMEANAALIASAPDMRAALDAKDAELARLSARFSDRAAECYRLRLILAQLPARDVEIATSKATRLAPLAFNLTPTPKARETEGEVRK